MDNVSMLRWNTAMLNSPTHLQLEEFGYCSLKRPCQACSMNNMGFV